MSVVNSIDRSLDAMVKKQWDRIYGAIDLHDTIIPSSYQEENELKFFPYAKETLQAMTESKFIKLILFTSSFDEQLEPVFKFLEDNNIHFQYINENPEVTNTNTGNFTDKFYYNFLIDDKAGFDANKDWKEIYERLVRL